MIQIHQRSIPTLVAAVCALLAPAGPAPAGCCPEKLLAEDGQAGDRFGYDVAVDDGWMVIGAPGDNERASDAGAVYVYHEVDSEWALTDKLTASDGAVDDAFGFTVAINGTTAVVGTHWVDDEVVNAGAFYVFDVNTGEELFRFGIEGSAESDEFGIAVSVSGGIALIGAHGDSDGGDNAGAASLYHVTMGEQPAKLVANDASAGDKFGRAVAIDGDLAVVGAFDDADAGSYSAAAYVYDVSDPQAPVPICKLTADDAAVGQWFGYSVAIDNQLIAIGASASIDPIHEPLPSRRHEPEPPAPKTTRTGDRKPLHALANPLADPTTA